MSDHAGKKCSNGADVATGAGEAGLVAFWAGGQGAVGYNAGDLRPHGKKADSTVMLDYIDDDHSVTSDPRFWGDELRQKRFEDKRTQDAVLEARRSKNAGTLHDIPAARRIEEQVVGSTHRFVIARPRTSSDLTALIMPTIRSTKDEHHGFTALLPPTGLHVINAGASDDEIAVQFEPQQAGPVSADLVLDVRWTDGSVDTRVLKLHATARLRTEIPE
ncbi:MAG: hypothetical protein ACKV2T_27910 [Kofleriaceae bacterium]